MSTWKKWIIDTRSICLHSGIPRRSAHTSFSLPMGGTCTVPSVKRWRSLVAVHHLKLHAQDRSFPLKILKKIEFWCQVTGRALKRVLECVNEIIMTRELHLISPDRNYRLNFWWSHEIMEVFTFSAAKKDGEIFRSAPINPIILTLLRTEKPLGRSSLVCWLLCCLIDSCN